MQNQAELIIRCPYCRVGNEFRPMVTRAEGWLQCGSCGHNAMPLDPEFKCVCSKCDASQSQRLPFIELVQGFERNRHLAASVARQRLYFCSPKRQLANW